MFTGIIEKKGVVQSRKKAKEGLVLTFTKPKTWKCALGESVAVDGVCSTVIGFTPDTLSFQYMHETLEHTTIAELKEGAAVHLEQSMRLGDRVHGHLVQGHVSSVGTISAVTKEQGRWNITIDIVPVERKYIIQKGSIAINGVSLTIAKKTKTGCMVSIIPHTLKETTLGALEEGDRVNIETDFLVRAYAPKS